MITLTFDFPLNVSVQVGDCAYFVPTTTSSNFNVNSSSVQKIGIITSIIHASNTIVTDGSGAAPSNGDFILFSKDNKVNMTSLLGYYASTTIRNNSTDKSELFNISADYIESSK
tara:strand:- start:1155 stop:1496 length:342 start_codon:yes stop_codon:yes gene_type:complete